MHHSRLGEVWLDDSSDSFKADSFGLADGSVFAEGDSVLSLSSPVFSSELALLSSLSAAFSGTDASSALEDCRGKNTQGNRRRREKVGRGQRDKLKGVEVWQTRLLKMIRWVWLKCDEPWEDGQDNKGEQNDSDG